MLALTKRDANSALVLAASAVYAAAAAGCPSTAAIAAALSAWPARNPVPITSANEAGQRQTSPPCVKSQSPLPSTPLLEAAVAFSSAIHATVVGQFVASTSLSP